MSSPFSMFLNTVTPYIPFLPISDPYFPPRNFLHQKVESKLPIRTHIIHLFLLTQSPWSPWFTYFGTWTTLWTPLFIKVTEQPFSIPSFLSNVHQVAPIISHSLLLLHPTLLITLLWSQNLSIETFPLHLLFLLYTLSVSVVSLEIE